MFKFRMVNNCSYFYSRIQTLDLFNSGRPLIHLTRNKLFASCWLSQHQVLESLSVLKASVGYQAGIYQLTLILIAQNKKSRVYLGDKLRCLFLHKIFDDKFIIKCNN
jgi:hypothetical protein